MPATVITVAFVAGFLVVMERPVRAAGVSAVPLTSIMGASVVLFGLWALALVVITWSAVHLRQRQPSIMRWISGFAGQVGTGFIAVYAMHATWNFFHRTAQHASPTENVLITLVGCLAVAALWQAINNSAAYPAVRLTKQHFPWLQLFRAGVLASLYAYLFVALYRFGGLIAAALFYVVLAQHRMVTEVVGVTTALQKLDRAREQAQKLVGELMRFRDTDSMKFASEVQNLAQRIGRRLGMSRTEIATLGLAAELLEIGLARLPPKIRQKENLTPLEMEQFKTYPRIGGHMIREADALLPNQIADWIESQGERWDGTGYPRGLVADEIPLPSRIMAICRDYVRLTSAAHRSDPVSKENALAVLRERAGTVYDPDLVNLFLEVA